MYQSRGCLNVILRMTAGKHGLPDISTPSSAFAWSVVTVCVTRSMRTAESMSTVDGEEAGTVTLSTAVQLWLERVCSNSSSQAGIGRRGICFSPIYGRNFGDALGHGMAVVQEFSKEHQE